MTSSAAAASATVQHTTPLVEAPNTDSTRPVMRFRLALRPTRPLHEAGMRMDPPPSDAWAMGAMPDATAAPAPPDEPPGVWSVFHGLRVMPRRSDSVIDTVPNSGVVDLPMNTNPAARRRATSGTSAAAGPVGVPREPNVVGHPSTSSRSLMGIGTPWNGGRSSAGVLATASVAAAAWARAVSSSRKANALSDGFTRSTWAR